MREFLCKYWLELVYNKINTYDKLEQFISYKSITRSNNTIDH